MASTRAQLRTRILRRADAEGSGRWDTTVAATGEVDQMASVAYDREWVRVLDVDAMARAEAVSVTSDSTGAYALSSVVPTSGRRHRILGVYRGGRVFRSAPGRDYVNGLDLGAADQVWYRFGDDLILLPAKASTSATFTLNSLPPAFTGLSDSGSITVPSDAQGETFEEVVALEAAALLLEKGGAEGNAAMTLRQTAAVLRQQMLNDLARLAEGPMQMRYDDDPMEWAG